MKYITEHKNKTQATKAKPSNFFCSNNIYPKLTINEPNDQYEQEADAIAEQVMTLPENNIATSSGDDNNNEIISSKFSNSPHIHRKCKGCKEEEEEMGNDVVQQEKTEEGDLVRTKSVGDGIQVSSSFQNQLQSTKGNGIPLPKHTNQFMNNAFGTDFSHVRIHTGQPANQMSQSVQAKAFTHGSDIYFRDGSYNPVSSKGKHLLAHELTHIVQQGQFKDSSKKIQRKTNKTNSKSLDFEFSLNLEGASRIFVPEGHGIRIYSEANFKDEELLYEKPKSFYNIELVEERLIFKRSHGYKKYPIGEKGAHKWENLPEGNYYLVFTKRNPELVVGKVWFKLLSPPEKDYCQYSSGLDPNLKARFNHMLKALEDKEIRFRCSSDVRPREIAHIVSTAYHIYQRGGVTLEDLRSLREGKDIDGNVWYKKEWEKDSTEEEVLEKAKNNAFELAKKQGSGYVNEPVSKAKYINCAYEGYEKNDEKRRPNIPDVPVSSHVLGKAIDLRNVEWGKLGGEWSPEARRFVQSFGLWRPFTPETKKYCISEHWHFELAP